MNLLDKMKEVVEGAGEWLGPGEAEASRLPVPPVIRSAAKEVERVRAFQNLPAFSDDEYNALSKSLTFLEPQRGVSQDKFRHQGNLFRGLAESQNPETVDPRLMQDIAKQMNWTPDLFLNRTPTSFLKRAGEFPRKEHGRYDQSARIAKINQYSDFEGRAIPPTPPEIAQHWNENYVPNTLFHENMWHALHNDPNYFSKALPGISEQAGRLKEITATGKLLDSSGVNKREYKNWLGSAPEVFTRRGTGLTREFFESGGRTKEFVDALPDMLKEAIGKAEPLVEGTKKLDYKKFLDEYGKLAVPALAAGALVPSKVSASDSPVVTTSTDKNENIPAGDIAGDFNAGASGAIDVLQGIAGEAGGLVQRTSKSLGKVLDIVTGQTTARSEPLDGDDYERLINTAAVFFNPVGIAANTALATGFDFIDPAETSAPELTPEMLGSKQEFRTTPYADRAIPEVVQNVALGAAAAGLGALALKSKVLKNETGAINMKGFFSPLTKAVADRRVGKSIISDKMSGDQVLKTLQGGGIKEDELVFSGVGDALSAIGKDRIGPTRMAEIEKIAEEGALGFSRKDSPGAYSNYSLFKDADPSFKNAVYTYPGVKFEESHFGEGVVAHRRFGDKELFTENTRKGEKINALHLDEVQSQFHERGSRFGYGEAKNPPATSDHESAFLNLLENNKKYAYANKMNREEYPDIAKDVDMYRAINEESYIVDRSTPQGFAKGLQLDTDADKMFKKYRSYDDKNYVENAPLRGEKYVELLAKDHLRDALTSGKDAISWTPSEVQHNRYYGKEGLGSMKWEFPNVQEKQNAFMALVLDENSVRPDYFKSYDEMVKFANAGRDTFEDLELADLASAISSSLKRHQLDIRPNITIMTPNGQTKELTSIEEMTKNIGSVATKKLLEEMQSGVTSGTLEGNAKEVYQKLYDRAWTKETEKLTGEKTRSGFTKDRYGADVRVDWVPLDKVKEKMVSSPKDQLSPKVIDDLDSSLEWYVAVDKTISDVPGVLEAEQDLLTAKKANENRIEKIANQTKTLGISSVKAADPNYNNILKRIEKLNRDLNRIKDFKDKYLPKVKDLPIAHAQEVLDFFNLANQALA